MKRSDAEKVLLQADRCKDTPQSRGRGAYKLGVGGWERGAETSECERQMRVMVRKGTGEGACLLDLFCSGVRSVVGHMSHIYGIAGVPCILYERRGGDDD